MTSEQIIHIEEQILSTILYGKGVCFEDVADILKPSDFMLQLHNVMFKACLQLFYNDSVIDESTVCIEMQKEMNISLDDVIKISIHAPLENLDSYLKIIKDASIRRDLVKLAGYIHKESTDSKLSSDIIIDTIESKTFELSMDKYTHEFASSRDVARKTLDYLYTLKNNASHIIGVDTGFMRLNHVTAGFKKGELIVIGARPSMGKTALILSMIVKIISSKKGVALFNLEMSNTELMMRIFSTRARVPMHDVRIGKMDEMQWSALSAASQAMCDCNNFYIDDGHNLTLSSIRSKLRKLKSKDPSISIAFIDYLQLMQSDNRSNAKARHEEIAEISRGLKKLARELEIPIVALAQLNRSSDARDDHRPILSDLKDSGSIEQDADVIIFIYRDEVYKERAIRQQNSAARKQGKEELAQYTSPSVEEAELIVAKNRNGEVTTVKVLFEKQFTLFADKDEVQFINESQAYHDIDLNINIDDDDDGIPY